MSTYLCCDGVARRDFIRIGAVSALGVGFGLPQYLAQAAAVSGNTTTTSTSSRPRICRRSMPA